MSSEESLHLVYTPYHMVLSFAIAAQREERTHVFLRPRTDYYITLFDLLTGTGVYESEHVLEPPFDEDGVHISNRHRKRVTRDNIRAVRSFLEERDVGAVYSALWDRELVQAALHFAKRYGSDATGVHLEDGGYEYESLIADWSPYHSDLLNTIVNYALFGFKWSSPPMVRGETKGVTEGYFTFPEFVRPELSDLVLHQVGPEPLYGLGTRPELESYISELGTNPTDLDSADALLLMPLNRDGEVRAKSKRIRAAMYQALNDAGYSVALKYHPRQRDEYKMDVAGDDEVIEIPKQVPVELIYASKWGSFDAVIGSHSTALKSAVWLLDDPTVVSIYRLLKRKEMTYRASADRSRLMENFRRMGIHTVEKEPEVIDLLGS